MSLTKSDIIEAASENLGIPKKDCIRVIESVFAIIKEELEKGNPVKISGFGKLTVKAENKRRSRNPQTGKELIIEVNGQPAKDKPMTVLTEPDVRNIFNNYIDQQKSGGGIFSITDVFPVGCRAYNAPKNGCWYVSCAGEPSGHTICSSRLVAISKATGEVVYDGSANDEG